MDLAAKKLSRPAKKQKLPLTRADWVKAAKDLLVTKSIDAVRVEVLAKQLKVSRGSFYWHFVDRQDLLMQVLYSWRDDHLSFGTKLEAMATSHQDVIRELLSLPFHGRTARREFLIESAFRAWARRDETAAKIVANEDKGRLDFYRHQFLGLGYDVSEADARAFTLYCYQLGESTLWSQGTDEDKKRRFEFLVGLLTTPKSKAKKPYSAMLG